MKTFIRCVIGVIIAVFELVHLLCVPVVKDKRTIYQTVSIRTK